MLFIHRGILMETLIIMLALPFCLTGAVWLLSWLDYNLSVAVWVGMIAVSGLAIELGLLMMLYLDLAYREQRVSSVADLRAAIVEGAGRRIRPMLMTGLASVIGLIPIMLSTGAGADVMKRIAAPMVGGVISALLMVLLVYPAVFSIWRERGLRLSRDRAAET
jgi:Cu(I)/Ag(I) efflux system membrane protein CusA/SilA